MSERSELPLNLSFTVMTRVTAIEDLLSPKLGGQRYPAWADRVLGVDAPRPFVLRRSRAMKQTALRLALLMLLAAAPLASAQGALDDGAGRAGSAAPTLQGDSPAATPAPSEPVRLPRWFYKRFVGTIDGRCPIAMNLMRDGERVAGDYSCERGGTPIDFAFGSRIRSDGTFTLRGWPGRLEADPGLGVNGVFEGRFTSDGRASGTWSAADGTERRPFSLHESYPPGSSRFEVARCAREWVAERGEASIEIIYPILRRTEHPATAERISSQLLADLLKGYGARAGAACASGSVDGAAGGCSPRARAAASPTVDSVLDDFMVRFLREAHSPDLPVGYTPRWEDLLESSVVFNSRGILGIRSMIFTFEGGAHPNTTYDFANYDAASGKRLALSDLLKPGYEARLAALGEAALRKDYRVPPGESLSAAGFFIPKGGFTLTDNFLITAGGLEFQFNQYEIGPYVLGSPALFIPYAEIEPFIRPDGPLGCFAR